MINPISNILVLYLVHVKCYSIAWIMNLWLANVVAVIECTLIQYTSQGFIQRGCTGISHPQLESLQHFVCL